MKLGSQMRLGMSKRFTTEAQKISLSPPPPHPLRDSAIMISGKLQL